MPKVSPDIQRLAAEIIAFEAADARCSDRGVAIPAKICATLRSTLITVVGQSGYQALLSRALALACEENPSLRHLRIADDGSLEGRIDDVPSGTEGSSTAPGDLIVVHLLGLLATFIGESLTLGLVRSAWPRSPECGPPPDSESHS